MKGYMLDAKARKEVDRLHKKYSLAKVVDKVMINLILDGHAVEVPLNSLDEIELGLFLDEYERKGWVKLYVAENEKEVQELQRIARNKGMKISF